MPGMEGKLPNRIVLENSDFFSFNGDPLALTEAQGDGQTAEYMHRRESASPCSVPIAACLLVPWNLHNLVIFQI